MTSTEKSEAAKLALAKLEGLEQRLAKARARGQVEMHISLADLEFVLSLAGTAVRVVMTRYEGN